MEWPEWINIYKAVIEFMQVASRLWYEIML